MRDPAAEAAEKALLAVFGDAVPSEALAALADGMAAVIRPVVAEGIAAACGAMAAKAPPGYGLDHNGGQVVGYLGAGQIARRHATVPPLTSADESALNAAYFRGQRTEQERIAHQIERALPDSEARRVALEIARDQYYLLSRKPT